MKDPIERSQNRSRFTSEVTTHSYEVSLNSSQTVNFALGQITANGNDKLKMNAAQLRDFHR